MELIVDLEMQCINSDHLTVTHSLTLPYIFMSHNAVRLCPSVKTKAENQDDVSR